MNTTLDQPPTKTRRGPSPAMTFTAAAAVACLGWQFTDGPRRGLTLGVAALVAGAVLLGPKLREYAGAILVIVGGLMAGTSLLWMLLIAPAIGRAEQQIHDLTHPTVSVPKVDVGGVVQSGKDAVTGLIGGAR